MTAGHLDRRADFERRASLNDGYGNTEDAWAPTFTRWCGVTYLKGGETVMGARLEGRQPVILTVRADPDTQAITPDMRAIIDGRAYNIREFPRPTKDRAYLEMAAESGVASG